MTLGSNPSKFGVKRSNTRFMRIIQVQTVQYKNRVRFLYFKQFGFPLICGN